MQQRPGGGLGCLLDPLLLLAAPILLQTNGYSPFWLLLTAFIWNLLCRSPEMRKLDEAQVAEIHGNKAGYQVWVKPFFTATWISVVVYAGSYAVDRWLL